MVGGVHPTAQIIGGALSVDDLKTIIKLINLYYYHHCPQSLLNNISDKIVLPEKFFSIIATELSIYISQFEKHQISADPESSMNEQD